MKKPKDNHNVRYLKTFLDFGVKILNTVPVYNILDTNETFS